MYVIRIHFDFLVNYFYDVSTSSGFVFLGYFVGYCSRLGVYFLYNFISYKMDKTKYMFALLNRSFELFALKKSFLMKENASHIMKTCLTVQGVGYVKNCCYSSYLSVKKGVNLMWQKRNPFIVPSSFLDFLKVSLSSPKVDSVRRSLLWMILIQSWSHFVWMNLLILDFKSEYGMLNLSGAKSKIDLSDESGL